MRKLGRALFWVALVVGALVGLLRATAIRWWRIPDDNVHLNASIAPGLAGGDLVILWRLGKPKFGDLVVCPDPGASERMVMGRILGEEGDDVKVDGAKVTVNGRTAETEHACDRFTVTEPSTGQDVEIDCSVEAIGGRSYMRGGIQGAGVPPAPVNQKVPEGKVFLVSDNRRLPYDSRDFGVVDRATCSESVVFRLAGGKGFFDEKSRFTFIQ